MLRRFIITISMILVASVTSAVELQNGYVVTCNNTGDGILLTAPGELMLTVDRMPLGGTFYSLMSATGAVATSCEDPNLDLEIGVNHFVAHINVGDCLIPGAIRSALVLIDPGPEPVPQPLPFPWQRTGLVVPLAYVPLPDPQPPIGEYTLEEILKAYIPFPDPQPPIGE